MTLFGRPVRLALVAALAATTMGALPPGVAAAAGCRAAPAVPGAEKQKSACLPDLRTPYTANNGYSVKSDWNGLAAAGTPTPGGGTPAPGAQIDGYFPDPAPDTGQSKNTFNGWDHDAQFVIRLPDRWNGKLLVTGAPGVRRQYANDELISDYAVANGYAFASTDKGNGGVDFWRKGANPGDAVAEWHVRVTQLARAAKAVVRSYYGRSAARTYMTGISNGGYLTRWQIERHPELYDAGIDWEGTLFTANGPNLFTYLPTAVAYHFKRATNEDMYRAGFARGSEFLWPYHDLVYWGLTQKIYRAQFDPTYDPSCPGKPLAKDTVTTILGACPSDADYRLSSRPAAVRDALARVSLTGNIKRPLLTLHGTLDSLLPISTDSDVYTRMIASHGKAGMHRYYVVDKGNHVDGLYTPATADKLRPMLPCYRRAIEAAVAWVENGSDPAPSGHVPPPGGDPRTDCSLPAAYTPQRTVPLAFRPALLAAAGSSLDVASVPDRRGSTLLRLDVTSGRATARGLVPGRRVAAMSAGAGRVALLTTGVRGPATVEVRDGATLRLRARRAMPGAGSLLSRREGVWVAQPGRLLLLDPRTLRTRASVRLDRLRGGAAASSLGADPRSSVLYAAIPCRRCRAGARVDVVSLRLRRVVARHDVPAGSGVTALGLRDDAWLTYPRRGTGVERVNARGRVAAPFRLVSRGAAVTAVSQRHLWVRTGGTVGCADARTGAAQGSSGSPAGVLAAFAADDAHVFIGAPRAVVIGSADNACR